MFWITSSDDIIKWYCFEDDWSESIHFQIWIRHHNLILNAELPVLRVLSIKLNFSLHLAISFRTGPIAIGFAEMKWGRRRKIFVPKSTKRSRIFQSKLTSPHFYLDANLLFASKTIGWLSSLVFPNLFKLGDRLSKKWQN